MSDKKEKSTTIYVLACVDSANNKPRAYEIIGDLFRTEKGALLKGIMDMNDALCEGDEDFFALFAPDAKDDVDKSKSWKAMIHFAQGQPDDDWDERLADLKSILMTCDNDELIDLFDELNQLGGDYYRSIESRVLKD